MDWDSRMQPLPDDFDGVSEPTKGSVPPMRLDTLLPKDPETGTVTAAALQVYLYTTMDLMSRHAQPLSLIHLAVDEAGAACFGADGARLIGRAIARCVFQETRTHDVIGRAEEDNTRSIPTFMLVCPLMNEGGAAALAERLRIAMTAYAVDAGQPWLTVSAGVAGLSLDVLDPASLIERAAEALRSAQQAGGGRVWKHSDALSHIITHERPEQASE